MRHSFLAPLLGLALAAGVSSQTNGRHLFEIDSAASVCQLNGSLTVGGFTGAIVGNPSSYRPSGVIATDIAISPAGIHSGQILAGGGTSVTLPTVSASVANPLPGFPALATIQVTGLEMSLFSIDGGTGTAASFPIWSHGGFSTGLRAEIRSGTASVTGLINRNLSLVGATASLRSVNGTVLPGPDGLRMQGLLDLTLTLTDPVVGATVTINLVGTLVGNDRTFAGDIEEISLASGGQQVQRLSAGTAFAGRSYIVLGTRSGTSPGITSNGVTIPVNLDSFTLVALNDPNLYVGSFGVLDPRGLATSRFVVPAIPVMLNLQLHHAYGVFNGTSLVAGSSPVALRITP